MAMSAAWCGVLATALLLAAGGQVLMPVDEALQDQRLSSARGKAIQVLRDHNLEELLALVADDVQGFSRRGRLGVRETFTSEWDPNVSHLAPELSDEIVEALSLGGSFTNTRGSLAGDRQFCAPYVYSAYPSTYPQPNDSEGIPMVILRKSVAVKSEPDPRATTIATLSYEVVRVGAEGPRDGPNRSSWRRIDIGHRQGFVPADSVRDPEDFHVCFGSRGGEWVITAILRDTFPR